MNKKIYKAKILQVERDAEESENHIATAYVKILIEDHELWCFVPDWTKYFPYHPKPSKYGLGEKLIKNLTGKSSEVYISLVNYPAKTKIPDKKRKGLEQPYTDQTTVTGKIIEHENAHVKIDCGGIIIHSSIDSENQGKYKLGDYVSQVGIPCIYFTNL